MNNFQRYTIRTIWAIAKSEELSLLDEDLYTIVEGATGKTSLRELTQKEIDNICIQLQERKNKVTNVSLKNKRTDTGGKISTQNLRRKIFALCGVLGWNDDNRRIRAFSKRITGIDALEWLSVYQCNKVIEALKKMVERKEVDKNARMG